MLLGYERGSKYTKHKLGLKVIITGTRKYNCPFKLCGKLNHNGGGWEYIWMRDRFKLLIVSSYTCK